MADNVTITSGAGTTIATDNIAGVNWQRVKVGIGDDGVAADVSQANPMPVAGSIVVATASFSRPADTNVYAIGDAMLDATSAATVNANVTAGAAGIMRLHVGRSTDKTGMVRRLRLKTNDTAFANATVRVHMFKDRPTVTNGDNGAFLTTESNYVGYSDIVLDRHFSDAEKGFGIPQIGSEWNFEPTSGQDYIHAILETRTVVVPGSAKTWTLAAEAHQN